MTILLWSAELETNVPEMDQTHKEFVDLLTQVEAAPDTSLGGLWQELLAHTKDHFGQEDRWMFSTGFEPENCHSTQHKVVLEIMSEAAKRYADGDSSMIRSMLPELADWFSYHAKTMDVALAQHMKNVGFNPATGVISHSDALPQERISGCGGACSHGG